MHCIFDRLIHQASSRLCWAQHPGSSHSSMALIIYTRESSCVSLSPFIRIQNASFPESAPATVAHLSTARESRERLRNFAVISRRVFVRLTNRRPARGRVAAGTSRNSHPRETKTKNRRPSWGLLPPLRHDLPARPWHPRLILTRESHYFTHPFFLLRVVLTLSFIIVLAHRRPDPLSIRPVSPLAWEERYCSFVPLFEHLHLPFVRYSQLTRTMVNSLIRDKLSETNATYISFKSDY